MNESDMLNNIVARLKLERKVGRRLLGRDSIERIRNEEKILAIASARIKGIDKAWTNTPFSNQIYTAERVCKKFINEGFTNVLLKGLPQIGKTGTALTVFDYMKIYWNREKINGKVLYMTMMGQVNIQKQTQERIDDYKIIACGKEYPVFNFRPNESERLFRNRLMEYVGNDDKNPQLLMAIDEIRGTAIDSNFDKRLWSYIQNINLNIKTLTISATPYEFQNSDIYEDGCEVKSIIGNGFAGCITPFGETFEIEKGAKIYPIEVVGSIPKDLQMKINRKEPLTNTELKKMYFCIMNAKEMTGCELWNMIFRVPRVNQAEQLRMYLRKKKHIHPIKYYDEGLKRNDGNLEEQRPILAVNGASMAKTFPPDMTVGVDFCIYDTTNYDTLIQGVPGRLHGYKFKKVYYFTSKEAANCLHKYAISSEKETNRKYSGRTKDIRQPEFTCKYYPNIKNKVAKGYKRRENVDIDRQKEIKELSKLTKGKSGRDDLSEKSLRMCINIINKITGDEKYEISLRCHDPNDVEYISRAGASLKHPKVTILWRETIKSDIYLMVISNPNEFREIEQKSENTIFNTNKK